MLSTNEIKHRIRSINSTSQITKAMEVVSATKMRRSQEFALNARPYAVASLELLKNLLERTLKLPNLLTSHKIKNSLLVLVASDKGLAGAFNANILKQADAWIQQKKNSGANFKLIAIGKKAKDYLERRGYNIHQNFLKFGDFTKLENTLPLSNSIIEGYLKGDWEEVHILYTNFKTTLLQETVLKQILPVTSEGIQEAVSSILPEYGKYAESANKNLQHKTQYNYEYKFEPSIKKVLDILAPQLIRMHIHHVILESNASEHSARMVAMKNASENAQEIVSKLNLTYNKARQATITKELNEITSGAEVLAV